MTILILGAGIMQIPAIRIAREEGWKVVCADGNKNAPGVNNVDRFLHIDLKDLVGLEEAAREIQKNEGLDGVFTAGTDFSASVAWVAEKLGLPGIPYFTALNATDKIRMRNCFKENNVSSPNFAELSEEMDFYHEISLLKYPMVVKPVDNMGARGVRKINDDSELEEAVANAIRFSRTERAIIEEYISGEEYSLDAVVYKGEITIYGIALRHIYFPPYFIEMGHTMPADIDDSKREELENEFKKGIIALGVDNGAAKGDIIYSENGPVIGEIAARLSGGYMSGWTFPYSSERESLKSAMQISLGVKPDDYNEKYTKVAVERAFLSIPGTVESIENIESAHDMENVKDLFLLIDDGDKVSFPVNNVEKCGNIISSHKNREIAVSSAEKACAEVLIRLNKSDNMTGDFLYKKRIWPEDPFILKDAENINFYNALVSGIDFANDDLSFKNFKPVRIPNLSKETSRDWQGRKLIDVYKKILLLTEMTESNDIIDKKGEAFFWRSIIKGSIQGGLWFFERFCRE